MRPSALLSLLAACGDGAGLGLDAGFSDGGVCSAEPAGFCEGRCPSFDDSVAEVQRLAAGGRCLIAESGSCGPLRYTAFSSGFHGFRAWFTPAGALVAGYRFADTPIYCGETSYNQSFGALPTCEPVASMRYCGR